jgi:hypothetical protein
MAIIINIDVMLAKRKMSVTELTKKVNDGEYFYFKKRKGKSNSIINFRDDL